jgi:hypothetical protein
MSEWLSSEVASNARFQQKARPLQIDSDSKWIAVIYERTP